MSQQIIVGCEISLLTPLSSTARPETERNQVGVSQVWEPGEAEISQNTPEESLCWNQLHILQLQNCQSGQLV